MVDLETHLCDEGVLRSGGGKADGAERDKPWVLAACILGSSLASIDGSTVNAALPALQRTLEATAQSVQWIVDAYALFLAALGLLGGALLRATAPFAPQRHPP